MLEDYLRILYFVCGWNIIIVFCWNIQNCRRILCISDDVRAKICSAEAHFTGKQFYDSIKFQHSVIFKRHRQISSLISIYLIFFILLFKQRAMLKSRRSGALLNFHCGTLIFLKTFEIVSKPPSSLPFPPKLINFNSWLILRSGCIYRFLLRYTSSGCSSQSL